MPISVRPKESNITRISRRVFLGAVGGTAIAGCVGDFGSLVEVAAQTNFQHISYAEIPDYVVEGMTMTEYTRNWAQLTGPERAGEIIRILDSRLARVPNLLNEVLIDRIRASRIGELFPLIAERVTPGKTGYLLRVNSVVFENARYISDDFVEAVGVGREPSDALAEAILHGEVRVTPVRGRQEINYLWCTVNGADFKVSCADVALTEVLQRQASDEATRRKVTGGAGINDLGSAVEQIERANHWKAISDQKLAEVRELADRIRLESLNRRFAESQQICNELYAKFQKLSAEIAAHSKETALINNVVGILGALKTGFQVAGQYMEPRASSQDRAAWRDHQISVLRDASTTTRDSFASTAESLRALDTELKSEWTRIGIDATYTDFVIPKLELY